MSKKTKVYFRADGNAKMGLGHVIRSLALAEMLKDNFDCHFAIRNPLESLKTQILEVCESLLELPETDDLLAETSFLFSTVKKGEIIVLDGYHFKTDYQTAFKNQGTKVVCIDDINNYHFTADAVINHAFKPSAKYSKENYSKLYLGLDYCLLRKPFIEVSHGDLKMNRREGVFICFGGTDYHNLTLMAIKAVVKGAPMVERINVVIGAANVFLEEIENYIKTVRVKIKVYCNLSAHEMYDVMVESKWAIVPASTISMECFAIEHKVIAGFFVDNQQEYYDSLKEHKVIVPVGDYRKLSIEEFSEILKDVFKTGFSSRKLIDGFIKDRYLKIFQRLAI